MIFQVIFNPWFSSKIKEVFLSEIYTLGGQLWHKEELFIVFSNKSNPLRLA